MDLLVRRLEEEGFEILLRREAEVEVRRRGSLKELERLVIATREETPIFLRDFAQIEVRE